MFVIAFSDSEDETGREEYGKEIFELIWKYSRIVTDNETSGSKEQVLKEIENGLKTVQIEKLYYNGNYLLDFAILLRLDSDILTLILNHSVKKVGIPYHKAVYTNDFFTIDLLLEYGYNPNKRDKYGNTVLHYAILNKNNGMVKYLLRSSYRLNINTLNKTYDSPLSLALNSHNWDIAKALLIRDARLDRTIFNINNADVEIAYFLDNELKMMALKKNKIRREIKKRRIKLYDNLVDKFNKSETEMAVDDTEEELIRLTCEEFKILNFEGTKEDFMDIILKKIVWSRLYNNG
jgi:hypothetical protein